MKTMKILMVVSAMVIAGTIFYSCQKENTTLPVKEQGMMTLKAIGATYPQDCNTYCIEDGLVYQTTTSFTRQWSQLSQFPGYYKNNKYFTATAWNDMDYFYVTADVFGYQYDQHQEGQGQNKYYVLDGPTYDNYPFTTVIITLNGMTYTYLMDDPNTTEVETATTYTKAFPLPEGWSRCTEMTYTVRLEGGGAPVWLGTADVPANVTYTLFDDYNCCTPGFTYVDNGDQTYTFTYVPAEDMTNALVVFTFAQAVAVSGLDDWTNNGQTMQKYMDFVACETYGWVVTLVKDCNGGAPNNNVWTDFKVDGDSKKGVLPNITQPCP